MKERNNDLFELWHIIFAIFGEVISLTQALKAYVIVFGSEKCENNFINLARDSMWRQLLTQLAKIFDNAKTCGNYNCSLKHLNEMSKKNQDMSTYQQEFIDITITNLYKEYEKIITNDVRNTQLAHIDYKHMMSKKIITIYFNDVEKLVYQTRVILCKIGEKIPHYYVSAKFSDMSEIYEKELKNMFLKSI